MHIRRNFRGTRSRLKKAFWPNLCVGTGFQILLGSIERLDDCFAGSDNNGFRALACLLFLHTTYCIDMMIDTQASS